MEPNSLYARLELLDADTIREDARAIAPVRPRWDGVKAQLGQWGQTLVRGLAGSQDPHIVQKRDRDGNLYFRVYDPVSQSHHQFTSETDLRTWLDQRYYH